MGLWLVTIVLAEAAGPHLPPPQKVTPAQAAIALYHREHEAAPLPKPCRQKAGDEIMVCGQSSDRAPLGDQGGVRQGARTATGEMPSTAGGIGGSPMLQGKGMGLSLTIKPGSTKVGGNAD